MADDNNRMRPPRDMKGLLKFLTEYTAQEDSTTSSQHLELDPERKAFLEKALNEMTSNVGEEIANALESITKDNVIMAEENVTEQENALDLLSDYASDLNYAQDFFKIGGFPIILRCLQSPHSSLRSKSSHLIGEICQNQENLQEGMLSEKFEVLRNLLDIVDNDSSEGCKISALYATSCLVRGSKTGEKKFVELDGFSCLMRAMLSGIIKLSVKATFLLNYMIKKEKYIGTMLDMGYVELLINLDKSTTDLGKEMCSLCLKSLVSLSPKVLSICRNPKLNYRSYLETRVKEIENREECLEEKVYRMEILKRMK